MDACPHCLSYCLCFGNECTLAVRLPHCRGNSTNFAPWQRTQAEKTTPLVHPSLPVLTPQQWSHQRSACGGPGPGGTAGRAPGTCEDQHQKCHISSPVARARELWVAWRSGHAVAPSAHCTLCLKSSSAHLAPGSSVMLSSAATPYRASLSMVIARLCGPAQRGEWRGQARAVFPTAVALFRCSVRRQPCTQCHASQHSS